MKVSIIENDSDLVVASYEINFADHHHTPSDEEYYSEAWLRAIEEGIVVDEDSSRYRFSF
ncbi:hypothetical protein [Psychromonas sp.]|uniref:hypothetical protein n=1 Tax=Psychromonas sp. TaxID=1884585 RepID=UPI003564F2B0